MLVLCMHVSKGATVKEIKVTSPAFNQGEMLPKKYTCDGENVNPPLSWEGVPAEAKSLVILCNDPDAPKGTFTHWIVINLPSNLRQIPEAASIDQTGGLELTTSFGKPGYGGACPPSGTHRYYFIVIALDTEKIGLGKDATIKELDEAIERHIVAQGTLMATYSRTKS